MSSELPPSPPSSSPPPRRQKRVNTLAFRLTDDELATLEAAGARLARKRTTNDLARAICCWWSKGKVPEPCPPRRHPMRRTPKADVKALAGLTAQLGKVGSNVNQIARIANRNGTLPHVAALETIRAEIAAIKTAVEQALRGGGDDN